MNTHTEHDRQLAEKLKSLSLQPVGYALPPPRRSGLTGWWSIIVPAIALVVAALCLLPDSYLPGSIAAARSDLLLLVVSHDDTASVPPSNDGDVPPQAPPPVTVAPVARDVVGSGHVVALRSAVLSSKQTSRIADVLVEIGDAVQAGQILVQLDDFEARLRLRDAEIGRDAAQTALELARIDYREAEEALERSQTLQARNVVTTTQLHEAGFARDRARANVAAAEHDVAKAKIVVSQAGLVLDELTLEAPFSGIVTARSAEIGEIALAVGDAGLADGNLLTVTDFSRLVIDVNIAEASLTYVETGLRGEAVLDGFPDSPFAVEVDRVAPTASSERGTVSLRLALHTPPTGIRPNMAARVTLFAPSNKPQATRTGTER